MQVYADIHIVAVSDSIDFGLAHCGQTWMRLHDSDDCLCVAGIDTAATSSSLLDCMKNFPPQALGQVQEDELVPTNVGKLTACPDLYRLLTVFLNDDHLVRVRH